MGKLTLLLVIIAFALFMVKKLIEIVGFLMNKKRVFVSDKRQRELVFLFAMWFCAAFFMSMRARGFRYGIGESNFQLYDLAYFIAPFVLFVSYYCLLCLTGLNRKLKKVIVCIFIILFSLQLVSNVFRLNRFRGGWGNYFCSRQNAKKYVLGQTDHGLVLAFNGMHYLPFIFTNSSNRIENTTNSPQESEYCDLQYIEKRFEEGYADIFVLVDHECEFRNNSKRIILKDCIYISSEGDNLYDQLKKKMGRFFVSVLRIYHFKKQSGESHE